MTIGERGSNRDRPRRSGPWAAAWLLVGLLQAGSASGLYLERGGEGDPVAPGEPVVVRLERGAELGPGATWVLDGVDITGFARRDGDRYVLELPMQLQPGPHDLRVVTQAEQRALAVVVAVPRFHGSSELSVDGAVTHRAADNQFPTPPELDRTEGRAALQWRGEFERGPLRVTTYAPALFDSGGRERGLGRHWDLADFLGKAELGPLSLQVGQHALGVPSLVLQGFGRRGISLRADGPAGTFATGFLFRTEPITGFRERFGIDDVDNRLRGGSVGSEAIPLGPVGELYVAGTYLEAIGGEGGVATAGSALKPGREHGSAGDVLGELRAFDGRLLVGGEWARTRFDFDGGGGAPAIIGHAWQAYGELAPFQGTVFFEHPFDVRLFHRESESEAFFRSLGNPGAPSDLWSRDTSLDVRWAGLSLSGSFSRLQDNVDDDDLIITYRDDTWAFDASFSPVARGEARWTRFIGQPTFQVGWTRNRSKPIANVPLGFPIFDNNLNVVGFDPIPLFNGTTRTLYFAVQTSFERWSIGASHTQRRFDETSSPFEDQISKSSSAQFQWQVHSRVTFSVDGSREVTRFRDPAFKSTSKRVGAAVQHRVLPGRLFGSLRADWQRSQDSQRQVDRRELLLTASTSLRLWQATGNRPGVSVTVLGTYRDVIDEALRSNSVDAFQVFARVELVWAPRRSWGRPGGMR